jgi:hypothetical protein
MRMYRGDLEPDLVVTCYDGETPVNLTGASSIRVIGARLNGTLLFSRPVTGTAQGVVTMPWQVTDTATEGEIVIEVEVTWPGARPQTFRPGERVSIRADLG